MFEPPTHNWELRGSEGIAIATAQLLDSWALLAFKERKTGKYYDATVCGLENKVARNDYLENKVNSTYFSTLSISF